MHFYRNLQKVAMMRNREDEVGIGIYECVAIVFNLSLQRIVCVTMCTTISNG